MTELVKPTVETVALADGSKVQLSKPANMGDQEWDELKTYAEANPEEARRMSWQSKDATYIRDSAMSDVLREHYETKLAYGDEAFLARLSAMEKNADLAPVFTAVKQGGSSAAMQFYYQDQLMIKMNRAIG